jgi:hypothetical protein
MAILRHWPTALLVFYWCLMSPMVFACEAVLQLSAAPGFVERGVLGSKNTYVQRVYSGDKMSYSALIFAPKTAFNKKSLIQQTAKSMLSTLTTTNKSSSSQVKILNEGLLPKLDSRLSFLSYIVYEKDGLINVEASASIRTKLCWSVLRFSALNKHTKDEALNQFATLIRATNLVQ